MSWDAMLRDEEARARCCAPPASGEACVDCPDHKPTEQEHSHE